MIERVFQKKTCCTTLSCVQVHREWMLTTASSSGTSVLRQLPWTRRRASCSRQDGWPLLYIAHVQQCFSSPIILQVAAEAFAVSSLTLEASPGWAGATGTYVGCMFTDYGAQCP